MKQKPFLLGIFAMLLLAGGLFAQQDSTIYKLMLNPEQYLNKHVVINGIVEQYLILDMEYTDLDTEKTVAYVLRGDFGDRIYVKSHLGAPSTNTKYEVSGMFQASTEPYIDFEIIETKRIEIINQVPVLTFWDKYGLYILIAAGVIVLLLIVLVFVSLFRKQPEISGKTPSEKIVEEKSKPDQPEYSTPKEYKTIKLAINPPKTMRFMPGSLEIIGGDDKGKVFKMVGYPGDNGSVVTLGRDPVSGDRVYSHIQLQDPTVSRKQAEIIYKDGKIFIKNLSETNFTQVDGAEIKPSEYAELKPNSVIRTGAIEFKYLV